ncbi:hypothetical protein LCGC14_1578330 [marine sediment metagenome]|uniref:Uncharacterized protein n=1 Tax=marine sediment metagenome TaxID=412755 RepID=A0A0F9LHW8_9ZZZZ
MEYEQQEDYEPEDEQEPTPYNSPDKEFNFDRLVAAKPRINRVKPPVFEDLVEFRPTLSTERHLIDKAFYYRHGVKRGGREVGGLDAGLQYKWFYYYCGCRWYDNAISRQPINPCTLTESTIKPNERIMVLTIENNKRLGLTSTERWREECWFRLRTQLETAFNLHKQDKEQQAANQYHNIHSIHTEEGLVPEPQRGRLNLSPEDTATRKRLVRRYTTYHHRYNKQFTTGKDFANTITMLNELYDAVDNLGGVPTGWLKI